MTRLQKQTKYWRQSGQDSWETAVVLFRNKKYSACLFFCHLAMEKLIKGLVVAQTNKEAPHIHDLVKLAGMAKLKLSNNQISKLKTITTFNISGRYDEEKYSFYKKCTKPFTQKHFLISKKLFIWLKTQYQKK